MAAVGVTPEYIREMRLRGVPANDPDQAIQSRVLFSGAKGAPRPPAPPAVPQAAAASVARTAAIGREGIAVRGADGSSVKIGRGGVVVRNADGSRVVAAASTGDDDGDN
jgi:hypothetical protein